MIGKKQQTTQEDWILAIAQIENTISKSEIDSLISKTVADIKSKTHNKNVAYSYSAGKDSIVLQFLCEKADINQCVFVCCDLEYSVFIKWVNENSPSGMETINTGQNMEWLSKHQNMLFPQDSNVAAKWFHIVQHRGQEKYYKKHNLDMILLGRRRADGNYVGKKGNIYTNAKGITRYSPISEWTHEQVLACIHYYKLPLPPIYGWKNGYLCGTHNFAERQWTGSIQNGWKEVYEIEPDIVINASRYIESAQQFLNERSAENGKEKDNTN